MALQDVQETLESVGQTHLLQFLDDLDEESRSLFIAQLETVDWTLLKRLTQAVDSNDSCTEWDAEPADAFPSSPSSDAMRAHYVTAVQRGEQALREGQVAAFTVAGGDGSRLGWDGPKGTFPVTPIKGHSLFRVFAEKIRRVEKTYRSLPPWYVMTSHRNHDATVAFFDSHSYFGLPAEGVFFFRQGEIPTVDFSGKTFLAEKGRLATAPDGHGGSLKALFDSGALADMHERGVKVLSYFQVDNPLISVADPLFIGLHLLEGSEVSSRAIAKRDWSEKMGVFCRKGGRLRVVEYVDIPESAAKRTDPDGTLVYGLGSPAIHLFDVNFIQRLNVDGFSLPYHAARKRIPYVDETGTQVAPENPNGIKFETFVFDALPMAERTLVLEADRRAQFAPVKNASGEDSPESCRRMMIERDASWLEMNGCRVPRHCEAVSCVLEISPLTAGSPADLASVPLPTFISPNEEVYL